ncbi:MAG TPA: NUDIX domain-containing protein [Candidatus Portnoybacteria bacterium]|nr:NUDIX domain-containing protein [Candidatus Portnoybacteria bacterium]
MIKSPFIWRKTAGAIIFHQRGKDIEYLILKHKNYWNFPKGGVEKGETEIEAARREIQEETGLVNVGFIPGFKVARNLFYRTSRTSIKVEHRGRLVYRRSILFLAESKNKTVRISKEHFGYAWLGFEEAKKRLAILGDNHKVLIKADKFLHDYLAKKSV